MRPLLIDNEAKARIAEVVKFAESNLYRPGLSETIPGDDARHVVKLFQGFRAVFSFTERGPDILYRHLSISVTGERYPSPLAAFTIASEFGFTGWKMEMGEQPPADWIADINRKDHCVTLFQKV